MVVGPGDEVFPVGAVGVAAVVLTPCEGSVKETLVDGGHFGGAVVLLHSEVVGSEKAADFAGGDRGHEAALLIEPFGIAFFGDAVTDEDGTGGAEGD